MMASRYFTGISLGCSMFDGYEPAPLSPTANCSGFAIDADGLADDVLDAIDDSDDADDMDADETSELGSLVGAPFFTKFITRFEFRLSICLVS